MSANCPPGQDPMVGRMKQQAKFLVSIELQKIDN